MSFIRVVRPLQAPAFAPRLARACAATVRKARQAGLELTLHTSSCGDLLPDLLEPMLAIACELVDVAVREGMDFHLIGTVTVRVESGPRGTCLSVCDDGWATRARDYEFARLLTERCGGRLEITPGWDRTRVTIQFPRH